MEDFRTHSSEGMPKLPADFGPPPVATRNVSITVPPDTPVGLVNTCIAGVFADLLFIFENAVGGVDPVVSVGFSRTKTRIGPAPSACPAKSMI